MVLEHSQFRESHECEGFNRERKKMDIFQVLKRDHDNLKTLLDQLVHTSNEDSEKKSEILEKIRNSLVPHIRAEEAVFYNSLREIDAAKGLIGHSYAEHAEAETLLHELQVMDTLSINWLNTAKKFKAAIEHHISEEENKIFTAARHVLVGEETEMMARAFEALKPEVREQSALKNAIDLVANMMPARFTGAIRSFNHQIKN